MAQLFIKQAQQYLETRPNYPQQLFQFIASKTPSHDLAWDVGTGSGQAATSIAESYKKVDTEYRSIDFPFEPVDGLDHTGPFQFKTERLMTLDEYFMYLSSWSSYQTAKEKGVELLSDGVVKEFTRAWGEDGTQSKTVVFPVYLRIGKVGSLDI
ncbi:hypothetical protein POM88_054071 [Heracleum sosnowskyi]|uniref:Methyltransferase type 11 domain-containing protein n=1 Tax=Heracleum sosnowskyi TaxID=360622 RepID=A0AAD8GNK9_9APIA|nr:hypothetical protein POM88_054071 [Heracleum sosnowskyi]